MARLDRVIQALFERKAQALQLAPGKPATLHADGAAPQALTQPLQAAHVLPFVRELLPAGSTVAVDGPAPASFTYDAPAGRVDIAVTHEADGAHVHIRPAAAAAAAPPPAAPPAPDRSRPPRRPPGSRRRPRDRRSGASRAPSPSATRWPGRTSTSCSA
ncbi:MAG: hypothetical protein IPK12_12415 [Gemmatimonadetes bacterium]|nr:hypothetical protein [Gemmatimonadota bacterium]